MNVKILTSNLKKALGAVERLAKKNLSLPVLNNVLLETEKNIIKLTTTNLETSLVWRVLSNVAQKGKVAVSANFLNNLVRLIEAKEVTLEQKDKNLILKTEQQQSQIQGVDPDDFPIVPTISKKQGVGIGSQKLAQGLNQVIEIPSTSQVRPEISGIYFEVKGKKLKIVATDSFRLAEKTLNLSEKPDMDQSFILPQNSSRELFNILSLVEGSVDLFFDPDQVMFEWQTKDETSSPQINLFSRLVTGDYPNYQEIIPKKSSLKIILEREVFLNQIKKAGLFSGKVAEVRLLPFPDKNEVKILSQSADIGKSEDVISAEIKGEKQEVEIAFNYKYLVDGLKNIPGSEVVLELTTGDNPGLLKGVGDATYFYILMPIKSH